MHLITFLHSIDAMKQKIFAQENFASHTLKIWHGKKCQAVKKIGKEEKPSSLEGEKKMVIFVPKSPSFLKAFYRSREIIIKKKNFAVNSPSKWL